MAGEWHEHAAISRAVEVKYHRSSVQHYSDDLCSREARLDGERYLHELF